MARPYLAFKVRSEAELEGWRSMTPEQRLAYGCALTDAARKADPEGFARMTESRWQFGPHWRAMLRGSDRRFKDW